MVKIGIGIGVVICVVGLLLLFVLTSPLTGIGVYTEKLERVSSFSFRVDEDGLNRAERTLTDYAHERGLKVSRLDIPVEGRKVFHLQIALVPSETILTADNVASPNRLDVRVSSAASSEKWQQAVQDIKSRLEHALGQKLSS